MPTWDTCEVFGVPLARLEREDLLGTALAWGRIVQPRTILYANAHTLNLAYDQPAFRDVLRRADLVYTDGLGAAWAARWTCGRRYTRLTARAFSGELFERLAAGGLSVFLLGGQPGVAAAATRRLVEACPGLDITGFADGYFAGQSEGETLAEIRRCRPALLLVGMGSPRQELWIERWRAELGAPVVWAVGALFDYIAGVEPGVPPWLEAAGLEWAWRLMVDFPGKWRRYLLGNPKFILRVLAARHRG